MTIEGEAQIITLLGRIADALEKATKEKPVPLPQAGTPPKK